MYQSIATKALGPTNTTGQRVKATSASGISIIMPWDHSVGYERNHVVVAKALAIKLAWSGRWHGGSDGGAGYVFVMETGDARDGFAV
jgi:hypothetical protein